ncbi:antibiotic biosynthesis monooxygenase [Natronoglycomyces albus]|uniref:Antibiotic biosynthesis monooxygenase n=1 Tax=Natronoglycomyces albus TaxID=2811108 RepID=A0A895XPF6_9ACTN|nr:antibiotic biosynthesis monooxygenase [Natronoglycomyces albus]QSB04406.1 antibiotic biosynthesis monooxygenase [Natronoglycomyces albus]
MLVVNRFRLRGEDTDGGAGDDPQQFLHEATTALEALGACAGFRTGRIARAVDEPETWLMLTTWDNVGSYRRALSNFGVKMCTPFLGRAEPEASGFEVLASSDGPGGPRLLDSDLAGEGS